MKAYSNTKIAPETTKAEIEKLLKIHGIKDIQWTTYKGQTKLQFLHRVTVKGIEKEIAFGFIPPTILKSVRQYNLKLNRYEKINVNNEPQAFRLLFWYLKVKFEAIENGLETVEKEFMSHILLSLQDGTQSTVGEALEKAIENGNMERFALPQPQSDTNEQVTLNEQT
jgi:hypothetical protein